MSTNNNKQVINRGVMWGQLLAFLEMGKDGVQHAGQARFLLSQSDQDLLHQANEIVAGILQRAWMTKDAEANAKPKRKRAKKSR